MDGDVYMKHLPTQSLIKLNGLHMNDVPTSFIKYVFDKVMRCRQERLHEVFQLATKHYEAGNFQQAEHICREMLEKLPNSAEILFFLGIICIQLQQSDSAIHYIQRSLQINSTNADAYLALGTAFQQKGLVDDAIICYQKTINLDPTNADSFNLLGKESGQ